MTLFTKRSTGTEWPSANEEARNMETKLIIMTAAGLAIALVTLLLIWIITRTLEYKSTILMIAVLIAVLGGIVGLTFVRVILAATLLVILSLLILTYWVWSYGPSSPSAAAFVIPIALASSLNLWAGLATAVVASAIVWGIAYATETGRLKPEVECHPSAYLTFNAPLLSCIFLLLAAMVGSRA